MRPENTSAAPVDGAAVVGASTSFRERCSCSRSEDWVAGKITRKRLEIKARKLGYDDFVCVSA